MTERLGDRLQIVGRRPVRDQYGTAAERDRKKGRQCYFSQSSTRIGTLSETLDAIELAKKNGYKTIVSTAPARRRTRFIADLAVAVNAGQIKTGAPPCRTERVAKYNRLLRISEC